MINKAINFFAAKHTIMCKIDRELESMSPIPPPSGKGNSRELVTRSRRPAVGLERSLGEMLSKLVVSSRF